MSLNELGGRGSLRQAVVGLVVGAVGGCVLGTIEQPVDATQSKMATAAQLRPLIEEVGAVGPLGLGSLMGATALTVAMTTAAAAGFLAMIAAYTFGDHHPHPRRRRLSAGMWVSAGLAAAFGATASGAALGALTEHLVKAYGMVSLLWTLCTFTVLKAAAHFLLRPLWKQPDGGNSQESEDLLELHRTEERRRILTLENGARLSFCDTTTRTRTYVETDDQDRRGAPAWMDGITSKHADFVAFSGVPMAVMAVVTTCLGLAGYGAHQAVLMVLLALVGLMCYLLLKSSHFEYWMLTGCMAMLATFVIAMLTLHAGQEALTSANKMRASGKVPATKTVRARVSYESSLEALSAAFFVARLCQLGLGAAAGGAAVRQNAGDTRVVLGAALVAGALLAGVDLLSLGDGGRAGALLGTVGAAGTCVGAVVAAARRWRSWPGMVGTLAGLVGGALGTGRWHAVNVGLHLPTAYVFAMTEAF